MPPLDLRAGRGPWEAAGEKRRENLKAEQDAVAPLGPRPAPKAPIFNEGISFRGPSRATERHDKMEKQISEPIPGDDRSFDLGQILGQNQAFALVAGRCSAAQVATLKRIRDEGLYKARTPHWRDFCTNYLKTSRTEADRNISLYERFGPGYFEIAQFTRISAETYRAIEPSLKDGALHYNGEIIELNPENAQKVAAAVAGLRKSAKAPARQIEMHERLQEIEKQSAALVAKFQEISREERQGENWHQFTAILSRLHAELGRIGLELGLLFF